MAKKSLNGFKDPVRRPRFIVWTFTILFALAAFVIVMLGATSTRWFCADVCHKVQDDTIRAYEASSHSEISCMACHEPVNTDTITFLFAKVKAGLEVIPTVGNTFTLPLNKGSALALNEKEMGSKQCTQCHSSNRVVTPSAGLIINHKVHAAAGIWCTVCHNRVAHDETAAPPKLTDPSGNKNTAHEDFMTMDACFRCHDLEGKVKMTGVGAKAAPGTCSTCHPAGFDLVPSTHDAAGWATTGHGAAARTVDEEYGTALAEAKDLQSEGITAYLTTPVKSCETCHVESTFCTPCHKKLKVDTTK
jgi:nitrate/TMAO reductase-like tetraheme cytochrome c subunit